MALQSRENMLKIFIDENNMLKETLKNCQKNNLIPDNPSIRQISTLKSKGISQSPESNIQNLLTHSSLKKQLTLESMRSLQKIPTIKDIKKNKVNISKGVFTTSRNFVKNRNSSKNS